MLLFLELSGPVATERAAFHMHNTRGPLLLVHQRALRVPASESTRHVSLPRPETRVTLTINAGSFRSMMPFQLARDFSAARERRSASARAVNFWFQDVGPQRANRPRGMDGIPPRSIVTAIEAIRATTAC